MSLLDAGPHTVTVYPEETVTDSRGNIIKRPAATGITVTGCLVTPASSKRDHDGTHVRADAQLFARAAPIGPWSRVQFNELNYFVIEGPNQFNVSNDTTHISALLREER